MFDVGFSEMIVIAVVALVVIGPERLPKVARTLGHLFGRLQRYVNDVKADINREMELEELRKFKDQFQETAQSVERIVHDEVSQVHTQMEGIGVASSEDVAPQTASLSPDVNAESTTAIRQADLLPQPEPKCDPGMASKTVT